MVVFSSLGPPPDSELAPEELVAPRGGGVRPLEAARAPTGDVRCSERLLSREVRRTIPAVLPLAGGVALPGGVEFPARGGGVLVLLVPDAPVVALEPVPEIAFCGPVDGLVLGDTAGRCVPCGLAPGLDPLLPAPVAGEVRRVPGLLVAPVERGVAGFPVELLPEVLVVEDEPEIPPPAGAGFVDASPAIPLPGAPARGAAARFVGGKGGGAPGGPLGGPPWGAFAGGLADGLDAGLAEVVIFLGLITPAITWISSRSSSCVLSLRGASDLSGGRFSMSSRLNSAVARRSSSSSKALSVVSANPEPWSPSALMITLRVSSCPHVGASGSSSGVLAGAMALVCIGRRLPEGGVSSSLTGSPSCNP